MFSLQAAQAVGVSTTRPPPAARGDCPVAAQRWVSGSNRQRCAPGKKRATFTRKKRWFDGDFMVIKMNIWGRGWMTKASGVGERRKGRGELRRDCRHRVAALFVPTRMQQWYIDMWYITMIYMGEGARGQGGPFRGKNHVMSLGSPGIRAKARRL